MHYAASTIRTFLCCCLLYSFDAVIVLCNFNDCSIVLWHDLYTSLYSNNFLAKYKQINT